MKTEQKILVTDFRAANSELTQREVRRECCVNVGKLLSRKDLLYTQADGCQSKITLKSISKLSALNPYPNR